MSKENYKNVTELTGFRSPSEQEQIGRYMQRKYQRSIKFDKVMGISCVIVGFLSAVLSFGNIAAIAVAVAFLINTRNNKTAMTFGGNRDMIHIEL